MTNDDSDDPRVPDRRYFQPPEERPNPRPRRRLPALPPHAQVPEQPGINLELHPVQPPQPSPNVQLQPVQQPQEPSEEPPEEPPLVPPRLSPRPQPSPNPQPRPASSRSGRSLLAPDPEGDHLPENGQGNS